MSWTNWRMCGVAVIALTGLGTASAQTSTPGLDGRVGRLEKEMRAVQRSVFPQGVPVQAELSATPAPTPSGASSAPITDLTARVDAIERQLATMTGATEQQGFRVRQIEESVARLQARIAVLEGGNPGAAGAAGGGGGEGSSPRQSDTRPNDTRSSDTRPSDTRPSAPTPGSTAAAGDTRPAPVRGATARPSLKPASMSPRSGTATASTDTARRTAVAAVELPATGDAAEDEYTYAYRLYSAKLYPEAQAKLKEFMARHPTHKRASYAQNLLGRAYYDEGKPALASVAFYNNYQKMPRGERASESLYYLGQSLTKLKKLPDACKVYVELDEVYGAKLSADMHAKIARGRADASCPG